MAIHKAPEEAEAALEDLEVKEVSVVDRPAIGRRFLVVKNADGDVELINEEEAMSRGMIPAGAAEDFGHVKDTDDSEEGLADLFSVLFTEDDDSEPAGVESITKTAKADALKATSDAMGALTNVVASLKQADASGDLTEDQTKALGDVAKALAAAADKMGSKSDDEDKTSQQQEEQAKSAAAALQKASDALQQLVQLVNRIKGLDDGIDKIDDEIVGSVRTIGKTLGSLAGAKEPEDKAKDEEDKKDDDKKAAPPFGGAPGGGGQGGDDEEEDEDKNKGPQQKRFEVFKGDVDANGDRSIVFKIGRSMRKTRLSKLRAAVKTLVALMEELDPKKDKATKVDLSPVTSQLTALTEAVTKANETVKAIDSRVATIEQEDTTVPAGRGEQQTEQIEKKDDAKKGLWDNLLH
jgi:chromosome segregation ATPase